MPKKPTAKSVAPKKPRKRKIILYKGSAEVLQANTELSKLAAEKKKLEDELGEIVSNYHSKISPSEQREDFLEQLPLTSMRDLQEFAAGNSPVFVTEILNDRSKMLRTREDKLQELVAVDKKISEHNINLLIAKINHVISELKD